MDDFTVVPQSLIKMLKTYAEKGYGALTNVYDRGLQDGQVAMAQAVLESLQISYNKVCIKDKQ